MTEEEEKLEQQGFSLLRESEKNNVIYCSGGGHFGANIFILPLFNNPDNLNKIVVFPATDRYKLDRVPFLFKGKAVIRHLPNVEHNTIDQWNYDEHKCIQVMKRFDLFGKFSCIPNVRVTENPFIRQKIDKILSCIENPIIFNPHHANWKPNVPDVRSLTEDIAIDAIRYIRSIGFTPVGFPYKFEGNHYPHHLDILNIPELSIEELTYAYKKIGKFFGVASGSADLMVAVGGKSVILIPRLPRDMDIKLFGINQYNWDKVFEVENRFSLTKTVYLDQIGAALRSVESL